MSFINTIKQYLSLTKTSKKKNGGNHVMNKKKRTLKKDFQPMNCHPGVKNKVKEDSCFTPEILMKIQAKYNENHPTNKITENDPRKIWQELKNRLECNKEECWLNQIDDPNMRKQITKHIFAPKHPPEWNNNPDEWLSNYDIFEVIKQYEVSHPEFKMIGPTTIDFDAKVPEYGGKCVLEDLCKFSLESFIRAKKTKIGIVFNLDRYYESGSHWVSMFIDLKNKFIFYFDSADNDIPREIWQSNTSGMTILPLVNRIIQQGKELNKPIHFKFYNNQGVRHQNGNTECGMYSLFFIITMLTGKTPFTKGILSRKQRIHLFVKTKIPDRVVFKYRKLYFND
jgi:hypothetical protein